eukprot:gene41044-50786_t
MLGCIWSCPTDQMLQFPVATMIRFCHNHGLIQVANRPQWWTVAGGARNYVNKILAGLPDKRLNTPVRRIERDAAGVRVLTDQGTEHFDQVVLATHSDQSLALLAAPTSHERAVLATVNTAPTLRATLASDKRIKGATVRATVYNEDGQAVLENLVMRDDGAAPDLRAGDGEYAVSRTDKLNTGEDYAMVR